MNISGNQAEFGGLRTGICLPIFQTILGEISNLTFKLPDKLMDPVFRLSTVTFLINFVSNFDHKIRRLFG